MKVILLMRRKNLYDLPPLVYADTEHGLKLATDLMHKMNRLPDWTAWLVYTEVRE